MSRSLLDLPKSEEERKHYFRSMETINQQLLLNLYGDDITFFKSKKRIRPLEDWIMQYDKVMGIPADCINIANRMEVKLYGDPRVDIYYALEDRVNKQKR